LVTDHKTKTNVHRSIQIALNDARWFWFHYAISMINDVIRIVSEKLHNFWQQ